MIVPISISNNFSQALSKVVHHIENPNYQTGTLIEEIPADIGRAYQGYKRGGIIEGAEKLRKETMAAAVWLFGIPAFNLMGKFVCEKIFNIPMGMDFSDKTIHDVTNFLMNNENPKGLDVSDLAKYSSLNLKDKFSSPQELFKKVKTSKMITLNAAVILNCLAMGVIIPKVNQALTRKKIKKMDAKRTQLRSNSFDEFKNSTSKKQVSFKGKLSDFVSNVTYLTENSNKYRLIITDVPMIIGRAVTSRNGYEALENTVIDAGSIFFYNFSAHLIQKLLRKLVHVPSINPMVAQSFIDAGSDKIKAAMDKMQGESLNIEQMFNKDFAEKLYKYSTFGKYGKINKYVSDETIKNIDNEVYGYLSTLRKNIGYETGKEFDWNTFVKEAKKYNVKSAAFLGVGFIVSIWGLATFMPKLAFKITTLLTGRNEFTGIADYKKQNKNNDSNVNKS